MFIALRTRLLGLAVALATSSAALSSSQASTVTFGSYDLSLSNAFESGIFGHVTVAGVLGGTAHITIDVSLNFVLDTGSHYPLTFSLDGGSVDLGSFSSSHFGLVGGSGPFSNSPFGTFTSAIEADCTRGNCGPTLGSTFSFDVLNFTGFNTATSLYDGLSVVFAVDVFNTNCTGACTGVVGAAVSVPGPIAGAGLPGIMVACGGLLALARRRRKRTALLS